MNVMRLQLVEWCNTGRRGEEEEERSELRERGEKGRGEEKRGEEKRGEEKRGEEKRGKEEEDRGRKEERRQGEEEEEGRWRESRGDTEEGCDSPHVYLRGALQRRTGLCSASSGQQSS